MCVIFLYIYVIMINLKNRRIVVNNDFDGCLCAKLLLTFYDCKVVGFSNSKDRVWFVDNEKFTGDELFIDMFTPKYDSIDQHIPPYAFERNWSANKDRGIYAFENYTRKYPFSTYCFLLSIAARDGYDLGMVLPKVLSIGDGVFMESDVLFRADDILTNYMLYVNNTRDWADYTLKWTNNNPHIKRIFDFMGQQNTEKVSTWKKSIDEFFSKNYGFHAEEIPNIMTDKAKKFMLRFGINFNKITSTVYLKHIRTTIKNRLEFDTLYNETGDNLFSFAFVYAPWNAEKKNFSYSLIN